MSECGWGQRLAHAAQGHYLSQYSAIVYYDNPQNLTVVGGVPGGWRCSCGKQWVTGKRLGHPGQGVLDANVTGEPSP